MDFSNYNFKEAQPEKVFLVDPKTEEQLLDDNGEPIWIEVHGADSEVFRRATREYGNRKLQRKSSKQTIEELEDASCKIMAAATTAWSGIVYQGEVVVCTREKAYWFYKEFSWVREQVDSFINERSNFLKTA